MEIDRWDSKLLSYHDFENEYMKANRPVIITGLLNKWKVWKEWKNSKNGIDLNVLQKEFGNATVPVVKCQLSGYGEESREMMTLNTYVNNWLYAKDTRYYLKDWHFYNDFSTYHGYDTPEYFTNDWLNWWWDQKESSDYRFVYFGPKDSWTPLHHDVFYSFSWSANVCGRKLWYIFPPKEELKLKHCSNPNNFLDAREIHNVDLNAYPNCHNVQYFQVVQEEGETIFIPSGYYHQVHNLEDTLSINHNWFNEYNLIMIWTFLKKELEDVEKEILHCKPSFDNEEEWQKQCQLIMRANSGIDMQEFFQLLRTKEKSLQDDECGGTNVKYALDQIQIVVNEILQQKQFVIPTSN